MSLHFGDNKVVGVFRDDDKNGSRSFHANAANSFDDGQVCPLVT